MLLVPDLILICNFEVILFVLEINWCPDLVDMDKEIYFFLVGLRICVLFDG